MSGENGDESWTDVVEDEARSLRGGYEQQRQEGLGVEVAGGRDEPLEAHQARPQRALHGPPDHAQRVEVDVRVVELLQAASGDVHGASSCWEAAALHTHGGELTARSSSRSQGEDAGHFVRSVTSSAAAPPACSEDGVRAWTSVGAGCSLVAGTSGYINFLGMQASCTDEGQIQEVQ